jgi:hypothetical protein
MRVTRVLNPQIPEGGYDRVGFILFQLVDESKVPNFSFLRTSQQLFTQVECLNGTPLLQPGALSSISIGYRCHWGMEKYIRGFTQEIRD